jgi:hypothetical protein
MMEAIEFCETSVRTKVARRKIPEGVMLYNHRLENLKSYIQLRGSFFHFLLRNSVRRKSLGFDGKGADVVPTIV